MFCFKYNFDHHELDRGLPDFLPEISVWKLLQGLLISIIRKMMNIRSDYH